MATKQGYIRGAAQEVFRRQPKAKGLYRQGGVDRIESERPDKFRGRTRFVLWMFFLLSGACFMWVVPGFFAGTVIFPELALLVHMLAVVWFSARQMEENPRGIVGHFFREGLEAWWWKGALLTVLFSMEVRLLAEGLPASWPITEALQELLIWAFPAAVAAGYVAAFVLGRHYVGFRLQTYDSMMAFEELLKSLGQPMTAQLHKSMRFRPKEVRIKKVPVNLASKYNDIELAMTKGRFDGWMLDPVNSSPKQIVWVPVTEEWMARRDLLRASHYTLVKEYDDEVSYEEIVRKPLVLPDDVVSTEATSPPTPHAAQIYEGVTSAKDLEKIQRWAETRGKTVVGYDLELFNSEKEQYENLVYLQGVTPQEASIVRRLAELLKVNPWDMWLEFHWVPNDEDDRDVHPMRIDTVVAKRSPVAGLSPEAREKFWLSAIAAMPKGSNGWTIEDDQASGIVILRYGTPLSLPLVFSTLDTLPEISGIDSWNLIPLGIDGHGEIVCIDLSSTPHIGVSGLTNSGKSTVLRHDIVSRLVRGHLAFVFDPAKLGNDFLPLRPWLTGFSNSYTETANLLETIHQEFLRRRVVGLQYGKANWYDLTQEQLDQHNIRNISIFFDEWQSAIGPVNIPDIDKSHPRYIQAVARKAAVEQIKSLMDDLGVLGRAWGIHLEFATQVLSVENVGKVLRPNLGGSIQLKAPGSKIESYIVRMSMGEGASDAIEQFDFYEKGSGGKGIAVTLADGGSPRAFRGAFISTDDAVELLKSRVPEAQPWLIHDVLNLGIEPSQFGVADHRVAVEAPVFAKAPVVPSGEEQDPRTEPTEEELDELTKMLRE